MLMTDLHSVTVLYLQVARNATLLSFLVHGSTSSLP